MIDLYYAPDNASLIIRIILEELGIDYNAILVDRSKQEQTQASYLALNPKGLIPVCVINGQAIFETAAIALTLEERSGEYGAVNTMSLAPNVNSPLRPLFLKWLFFISNTLHADLRLMFYAEKYVGADMVAQDDFRSLTRTRLKQNFTMLDDQYRLSGQTYLLGGSPSIIDIYLGLCMRWAQLYPRSARGLIAARDFPSIHAMLTQLQRRSAVVSACGKDGISGDVFSDPQDANPTEGSAL